MIVNLSMRHTKRRISVKAKIQMQKPKGSEVYNVDGSSCASLTPIVCRLGSPSVLDVEQILPDPKFPGFHCCATRSPDR